MKKTVLFLFALLLSLGCANAYASIELANTEICYTYSYDGTFPRIYFFADVINQGSQPASLSSQSSFSINDEAGNPLDKQTLRMIPVTLRPGEKGVVFAHLTTTLPDALSIKSYRYELQTAAFPWEYVSYPAELLSDTGESYIRLTNNSSDILWNPQAYIISRDANGMPVFVNTTLAYNTGIPSGQSLDFAMKLTPDLIDFLKKNDLAPVTHEAGGFTYR